MSRSLPKRCRPKTDLPDRPLLSADDARLLEQLFKLLANDTRLRLLHAIAKRGEITVGELAQAVGMKPQAVSNQLQRLSAAGIVGTRREGTSIHYRITDYCVLVLLERGLCLLEETERRQGKSLTTGLGGARAFPGHA